MSNALTTKTSTFDLSPQTFDQALTFSQYLADSDMVPKDYKGKPGNCLIAMQWGAEVGLKPLQALQNLAVINGRPALWGDSVIAIVRGSPLCEYVIETDDGQTATCTVKRRGEPEQIRTFSVDDARAAGLAGKQGPWSQFPKRMRQMRARAFALRDVFPDVLRGLPVAEEIMDTPTERHMGQAELVQPDPPKAPPAWPADRWAAGLDKWAAGIAQGKPIADVLAWLGSKAQVTPEQEQELRAAVARLQQQAAESAANPEQLAQELQDAQDLDKVYELGGLIDTIPDEAQRQRLHEIFNARCEALEQA